VTKGDLDLGKLSDEAEQAQAKQAADEMKGLLERVKEALGDRIKEVRVTHRLTSSPACLVASDYDMGRHLERLLQAAGQKVGHSRPILELNPGHPLVQRLDREAPGERFRDWAQMLHDQAVLAEGGQLEDPAGFVRRMNAMLLDLSAGTQ
jgi:molecular chaperone HtpG